MLTSIIVSTTLVFVMIALPKNIFNRYVESQKRDGGECEVRVYRNRDDGFFLSPESIDEFSNLYEYKIDTISTSAKMQEDDDYYTLSGYDLGDAIKAGVVDIINYDPDMVFTKGDIIISYTYATEKDLTVGDSIEIEIWGQEKYYKEFKIHSIANDSRVFSTGDGFVVSLEYMEEHFGTSEVGGFFVKTDNPEQFIKRIEEETNLEVQYLLDNMFIKQMSNYSTSLVALTSILAIIMSAIVIISSYGVVILERLQLLSLLRCMGATKGKNNFIMILEGLIYGIIGGVTGTAMGILVLDFVSDYLVFGKQNSTIELSLEYSAIHVVASILFACISTILCVMYVLIKNKNTSIIEDMNDSQVETAKLSMIKGAIFFSIFMILVLIANFTYIVSNIFITVSLLLIVALIFIQIIPYISVILLKIMKPLIVCLTGQIGIIVVNNIKSSKKMLNVTRLLTCTIGFTLAVNILIFSMIDEIEDFYDGAINDYIISSETSNDYMPVLNRIDGVKVNGIYDSYMGDEIDGHKIPFLIYAGDINLFFKNFSLNFYKDANQLLKEKNTIILSNQFMNYLGVEKGESITIANQKLKVVGSINFLLQNGSSLYMSKETMSNMNIDKYSTAYLQTDYDEDEIKSIINKEVGNFSWWIWDLNTGFEREMKNFEPMLNILKLISYLIVFIGLIGIYNNFIGTFISRKKHIALLRIIGMSKSQTRKLLITESIVTGIIAFSMGILFCFILIDRVLDVIGSLKIIVVCHNYPNLLMLTFIITILITVIVSLHPAYKGTKMNAISEL